MCYIYVLFFFFNDTATTEIYTLSLHDALPISSRIASRLPFIVPAPSRSGRTAPEGSASRQVTGESVPTRTGMKGADRKSTRLNSSHANISYAVFCLKKKKTN